METEARIHVKMKCNDGIMEVLLDDATKTMTVSLSKNDQSISLVMNEQEVDEFIRQMEAL